MSACPLHLAARLVEFAARIDEVRAGDRPDMEQAVCELRAFVHRLVTGIQLDLQPRAPAENLEAAIRMLRENPSLDGEREATTLESLEVCIDEMFRGLETSRTPRRSTPPLTSWFC